MITARKIGALGFKSRYFIPSAILAHSKTCPTVNKVVGGVCPGSGGSTIKGSGIKRAEKSGKVRLAFIPEEWFLFFHSKTGVSGPYIFGIVLGNYWISKEIFVMEHEFYLGLSWLVVIPIVVKHLGPHFAASLDKDIDDLVESYESERKQEASFYETTIKDCKDGQWRAEGQKLLMDAKKENIAMQLEAAYRERFMHVYRTVKGRMDYHVKRYRAEARIHQKWMIGWVLENVAKSITPEFEQQALNSAIQDLAAVASRA